MRLALFALSIIALLLVAAIIGPSFVDWNKYKPQIIEQVKNATGLDVTVGGDLSLAILPSPRVKIEDLVVAAPKKIKFENLLSMKKVEVSVALLPLLQKKIQVDTVTLISPDIQIEIMEDGTPSWETDKLAKAKEISEAAPQNVKANVNEAASGALDSIALDKLEIENGKLSFIDHKTKASYIVEKINVALKADSLKGPFDIKGGFVYDGKEIVLDGETGKIPEGDEGLKVNATVLLPGADTKISFGGVAAINAPYEVQGQTALKVQSLSKLAKFFGSDVASDESFSIDGLLTADENNIRYNDLKLSLGKFVGNGKFSVQDLKSKNPVIVNADIKSSSVLNLDPFLQQKTPSKKTTTDDLKAAAKAPAKKDDFVPQSLTLPMPLNVDMKFDVGGVAVNGQQVKGIFAAVQKTGKTTKVNFKALELPGQAKLDGALTVAYGSSSKTPKTGQVIYTDPVVSYQVNGQAGQLKTLLNAFAPDADTSAVTDLYKTAQFNLKGAVNGNTVSVQDSTLKLDQMVVGLGGRYTPENGGKRAKAVIDISAGSIDFDKILNAQGKGGKQGSASNDKTSSSASSPKEAVKPLQDFSLPLDLTFDVSLQKARINGADLSGLRLTGDLTGKRLNLKNASVNNFAGAVFNVKGAVGNLSDLSGIDLTFYTKASDVSRLAQALNADTSSLPKDLKAIEANISGKGSINKMNFKSNVKALGGQFDANGNASDLLGTPSFDALSIGLKHSNLVKAIQMVSPDFEGQAGLRQPIDFFAKASSNGKVYSLSDMKVSLGQTNFGGNLKIDTGSRVIAVSGDINAGRIALDTLLGADTAASSGNKSGGASSSAPSSAKTSASASGGRWSKEAIDMGWMNDVNVNVALSAASITYGDWNLTKPSTTLKIANGQLDIKGMKAGVFGGQANLTTTVKANPLSLSLSNSMNNIDLEKLVGALSGGSKLKSAGTVSFNMDVNAAGGSAHALVNNLNGSAALNGTDVTMIGYDLAKLARGLAVEEKLATSVSSVIDGSLSGGQTKFDTVKGDYKITNGVVNITSMVMDSDDAVITSTGTADLPKWFINVDNKITLKSVPDLDPFEVKIKGPIDRPGNTFGKNILEDYLTDKLKRKIGKELPGILGDDAANVLQGLGIIPGQKKKQAPVEPAQQQQSPANDNQAPAAQPAAPQPKKIEKPADALDAILNGSGTPEDAVKDVLKGLF